MSKSVVVICVVLVIVLLVPLFVSILRGRSTGPVPTAQEDSKVRVSDPASSPAADSTTMKTATFAGKQVKCPALGVAILEGNRERVQAMLDAGADLKKSIPMEHTGKPPSLIGPAYLAVSAVAEGKASPDFVTFIVKNGADVNTGTDSKATPLHLAAMTGREDIARALIELGANANARDKRGLSPLGYCRDAPAVAALLRENGATE